MAYVFRKMCLLRMWRMSWVFLRICLVASCFRIGELVVFRLVLDFRPAQILGCFSFGVWLCFEASFSLLFSLVNFCVVAQILGLISRICRLDYWEALCSGFPGELVFCV